jgi:hypothetical protein
VGFAALYPGLPGEAVNTRVTVNYFDSKPITDGGKIDQAQVEKQIEQQNSKISIIMSKEVLILVLCCWQLFLTMSITGVKLRKIRNIRLFYFLFLS